MTRMKRLLAVVGATALLAFAAPAAFAASGSDGYGGSNVVSGLEQGGSGGGGSGENAPAESTPTESAPKESAPKESAPKESAPAESTPAESAPVSAPVQATADEGGSLPFTGADLGVLAAAGGILLGLGFGLRRLTARPSH
jgi:hypothetical protein